VSGKIQEVGDLFLRFTAKGHGIRVALLDSGTDATHPSFVSNDIIYHDLCYSSGGLADEAGHGTHCAGAILSLAPGCSLYSGRIVTQGDMLTSDAIFDGVYWALSAKAHVVCICTGQRYPDDGDEEVITKFIDAGGCVVAAIGNQGRTGPDAGIYPARYPTVIAAGSVDHNGDLAAFTEMPQDTDIICFGGMPIIAPWLNHKYAELGGTSISAALISGLIALAISSGKMQLTPEFPTIKSRLMAACTKKESPRGYYYVLDPLRL
jgi:subtilisin family serine protease